MPPQIARDCSQYHICSCNEPSISNWNLTLSLHIMNAPWALESKYCEDIVVSRMLRRTHVCRMWLQCLSKDAVVQAIAQRGIVLEPVKPIVSGKCRKGDLITDLSEQTLRSKNMAWFASEVGQRGVAICSQPPEWWFHSFAVQSLRLPTTVRWHQGESFFRWSFSVKRTSPQSRHLIVVTCGTCVLSLIAM